MKLIQALPFIGRETFLQTMHKTLQNNQRVVLTGLSGVGKTAVAHEYVRRFAQQYQFVCWLDMATDETLLADLFDTLQALSLPTTMAQGIAGLFQTLQHYLAAQQDFLVVLDNPPSSFQVQNLSGQQQMKGHLLLITRSHRMLPNAPCLELTRMAEQDGTLLVLRRAELLAEHAALEQAEKEQHLAALELSRELRGWPIALSLAGGYIRETGCSVREYLLSFRDCPTQLHMAASSEDENQSEIAVACELSLKRLEQAHPATLELLQIASLLSPETLPAFLFEQESEQSPRSDEKELDAQKESMQSLLLSGLLTANEEMATLSMHPLVQDIVRQLFSLDKPQQQVERALLLFQRLLPSLTNESVSTRLRVAGHVRCLATLSESWSFFFDSAAEVFSWAAWLFWEQGLVGIAEPLLRRTLAIYEHTRGKTHPKVAAILGHLAMLNSLLKNYVEAEALSHRAIASKSAALGANHPDVLLALDQLGRIYAEQGKQHEARLCYEKALSVGERVGLRQHSAYNTARYDLALLHMEQARFDQAEQLLRRVCLVWGKTLSAQDPVLMEARFSLAEVSSRLKKWEQAETYYQQALPICEQLLGEEHPKTQSYLEKAALSSFHRGNFAEARHILQRVLKFRERTSGSRHPDLITCLNNLARIALAQEQIPEALALLERAQSISDDQAEPDGLIQAALLDTQGSIAEAQQQYEQAISLYQRALDLRQERLGNEHLDLVENLSSLATLYLAQKEFRDAEALLLQVLFIYQQAHKPEDLTMDPVLHSLAEIALEQQQLAQARMYLERLRAIRTLAWGKADPRTAEVAQKITELSLAQK